MSQSPSSNRKIAIGGAVALVVVVLGYFWFTRPAAQLKAPSDKLIDKLVAANPEQRDDMIIELGNRGASVIPEVTAAYEKASKDPVLRSQLVLVLYRTRAPEQAIPALERLLQKETDPDIRRTIGDDIVGLRRLRRSAP